MHSFLIDMCRSCLTTNVNLKEYLVVEDKEIKCFDAVKIIFPNTMVPAYCGYAYGLCEICVNLLKSAVIFHRRLSESHNAYSKYMETLNFSNNYKFFIVSVQHINKGYLPLQKADVGSRRKLNETPGNQIPTNDTYFEDILNDEDLNCGTGNDFDNVLTELDTKIDKKENISVKSSQEESKNVDNAIADNIKKEVIVADNDNCHQLGFNATENILCMKNINEESDKGIPMSDNDGCCYQLDLKIEVKEEHIPSSESTKNGHDHFEAVYVCEEQNKHEILTNFSAMDFKQEKTTNNSEGIASPILLIKNNIYHIRKGPHKCDVCGKSFTHNSNLIIHKRIHAGERPYQCDICEKNFTQSAHLITHKRLHTGESPYKCDICEKSFFQKSNLIVHKRIHTGERPYKCDVCEKNFSRKSILIEHKHIHTRERPYKCDVCEKSFSQKSCLIVHNKRIHTGKI